MLTFGQASCFALDKPQTPENRKEAKEFFENSPLTVVYLFNSTPMDPHIIAKTIVARNPFKYKEYPHTPPSSPRLSPAGVNTAVENGGDSDSSAEPSENYGFGEIQELLKKIYFKNNPGNDEMFSYEFISNDEIYDQLLAYLPSFDQTCSRRKLALWLSKETAYFGHQTVHRVDGVIKRARHLWVAENYVQEFLVRPTGGFHAHVRSSPDGWATIGYVRKSNGSESDKTRVRLLELMATRLEKRCLCQKIFVSPSCSSSSPLLKRDVTRSPLLEQIKRCDGSIQDLFSFVAISHKRVRLCVIDYAGLSGDPNDLRKTLKLNKMIKEIVVDHGSRIEILSRDSLLKKNATDNFRSRTGCVRRSQV